MLIWREVTPLSRLVALILFVGVIPTVFFYLGMQYQDAKETQNLLRTYHFPRLYNYTVSVEPLNTEDSTTTIELAL